MIPGWYHVGSLVETKEERERTVSRARAEEKMQGSFEKLSPSFLLLATHHSLTSYLTAAHSLSRAFPWIFARLLEYILPSPFSGVSRLETSSE